MTTFSLALPLPGPIPDPGKKRRVLLVDACAPKRELRAEAMRKLGMDVDCACDITEARSWWRADLYNLVLINLENELGRRDKFCEDIRAARPPQHVAFLVGKPEYLADLPPTDGAFPGQTDQLLEDGPIAESGDTPGAPLRWGIMAASRRISAVRSAAAARSTAMRNRPTPPRDLEVRDSRKAFNRDEPLLDLLKEELS